MQSSQVSRNSTVALSNGEAHEVHRFIDGVAHRVRSAYGREVPHADLVSWGWLGFLEARVRFETGRGTELHQYAYRRVWGAMLDGARKWSQRRADLPKRRPGRANSNTTLCGSAAGCCHADGAKPGRPSGTPSAWDGWETVHRRMDAQRLVRRFRGGTLGLPSDERQILEAHYFEGRSLADLARASDCSKGWVSKQHRRALHRARVSLQA